MGNGVIYSNCGLIEVTVSAGISWNNRGRSLRTNFKEWKITEI
jgi:hypothetical protein